MHLLNYPGCLGDTRSALAETLRILKAFEQTTIVSPFLTGGYFETAFIRNGISVAAYSESEHITQLWWIAQNNMDSLIENILSLLDEYKGERANLAKVVEGRYNITDKYKKSALMIVLNRLARNCGSMRAERKNQYFSNYKISDTVLYKVNTQGQLIFECDFAELKQLDLFHLSLRKDLSKPDSESCPYQESIKQNENDWLWIYPPSAMCPKHVQGENPSQMEEFNHDKLHELLLERDRWIFLAEDDGEISQKFDEPDIEIQKIKSIKVTDTYDLLLLTRGKND